MSRPWLLPRGNSPAGGMSATARDQIAWARFHLGGGVAPDGTRLLSAETIARMQRPTVSMPGAAHGDHVGISWMLRDVDGLRIVAHGGTTIGQLSAFAMVPERDFAVVALTNCSPNGRRFNNTLVRWALERYLGAVERDPEPVAMPDDALAAYVGRYETIALAFDVAAEAGRLSTTLTLQPRTVERIRADGGDPDEPIPPMPLALVAGGGDRFIVPEGSDQGSKGYFTRDANGTVVGLHISGRYAARTDQDAREPARSART